MFQNEVKHVVLMPSSTNLGINKEVTHNTRQNNKIVGTQYREIQTRKLQTVTWSDVPNDVWQNYTLGALAVRKIPEGYVIVEMYNTSRNERQPVRGGVLINDENYWPVN